MMKHRYVFLKCKECGNIIMKNTMVIDGQDLQCEICECKDLKSICGSSIKISRNAYGEIMVKAIEPKEEWDAKLVLVDGTEVELFYFNRHDSMDRDKNWMSESYLKEQLFKDNSVETVRYKDREGTDIHIFKDKIVKVFLR